MANPQLRYKESDRRRSINNLIRMVKANTINFDQAYQRDYVAYLRRNWQRKLISSILQGEIIPMIWFRILDDLNECIDGQQRCKTFVAFEDGEFKTPTKCRAWDEVTNKYYNIGGMFWSEILLKYPNMATDWFHNREIICIECENMTDEQASEKFYKLNDLNALSNQEMRQCVQTNYCEVIRELAQDHDLFNRLIEKDKKGNDVLKNSGKYINFTWTRRTYDEFVAQLTNYLIGKDLKTYSGLSKTILDKDYQVNTKYDYYDIITKRLDMMKLVLERVLSRKTFNRGVTFMLFQVCDYLLDTYPKLKVTDNKKFHKRFVELHKKITKLSSQDDNLKFLKKDELLTYGELIRRGKTGAELRWKLEQWKKYLRNTESFGIVVRDKKRVVSDDTALELLQEQDYECKVCGNEITSDTMRKGHTDAWAEGNPTTKENTVMLCEPCNSDMGDMSYDEYMEVNYEK